VARAHRPQSLVRFEDLELDLRAGELRQTGGKTVRLTEQPLQILTLLLESPGEVVLREEIRNRLWPNDTIVEFEHSINAAMKRLRQALGESADNPRYIETLARRGYRWKVPVQWVEVQRDDVGPAEPEAHATGTIAGDGNLIGKKVSHYRVLGVLGGGGMGVVYALTAVGLLLAGASVFDLDMGGLRSRFLLKLNPPAIHSLAVLPLSNLSNDPNQEYLSDGMTDALITDLAQIGSLKVASRTSSKQYKQTKKSLPEIARELNVDGIIEGTVQRSGDRVRINAQLIYGPTDKHIWANSYERNLGDVFALERDVTEDIARQIQARLTTKNASVRTQPRPMDPKALEAFLQGNYHLNRQGSGFGDEEKKKAAEYFQQAITVDPNFAPAYHGLALAHKNRLLASSEDASIARKAAEKAVEVDPNYSVALVTLAALKWIPDLDWRGAEDDLRRAIALNPNSSSTHSALCLLLIVTGHGEEGLRECRIAQRVDPFDEDAALGLYLGREYDGSIAMLRIMLQKDPNDGYAHCFIFPDYIMKGMEKESILEMGQCFSLFGQPEMAANIERTFEASGYHAAIRQWAREMEHLQSTHQAFLPGTLAKAYAILGDNDSAFFWLEQAYEHHEMVSFDDGIFYMGAEPLFDSLRSDPRFKALLRRVGLPS
jgi:TolB-like protein/DNA-binding winged helix-turn-helix (wHTH) protein